MLPIAAAARITESLCKGLTLHPPLHMRRLDFFRKSFWFQTSKARRLLGFEPTISFSAGVRDTMTWYSNAGYLKHVPQQQAFAHDEPVPTRPVGDVPLARFENVHLAHIKSSRYADASEPASRWRQVSSQLGDLAEVEKSQKTG